MDIHTMGTAENPIDLCLESEPDTMDDLLGFANLEELTDVADLVDLEDPHDLDSIQIYDDWKWLDSWRCENIKELFKSPYATPLGSRSNPIIIDGDNDEDDDSAKEDRQTTQVFE